MWALWFMRARDLHYRLGTENVSPLLSDLLWIKGSQKNQDFLPFLKIHWSRLRAIWQGFQIASGLQKYRTKYCCVEVAYKF